jgi:molybdopterin-containing oxidoreductase family iron-sulfur binding subunit
MNRYRTLSETARAVAPLGLAVVAAALLAAMAGVRGLSSLLLVSVGVGGALAAFEALRARRDLREEEVVALDATGGNLQVLLRMIDRRTAIRMFGMSALFIGPLGTVPRALELLAGQQVPEETQSPFSRIRQWAMIIDLRYCDGCQSVGSPPRCTAACVEGHLLPEPMEWIEVFEDELEGEGTRFIPIPCQHCQNPPCVNVCPVGATFSAPEGLVLIDQERCIGCRICMAACPYDRRFFNWGEPPVPPEAHLASYNLEAQVPALKGTVMKCDFCPDMVRAGTLPYCIQACPNQAIYYGDLEEDIATNGRQLVSMAAFSAEHNAFILKEELGTQPRVFYIPGHGEAVGRVPSRSGRLPTVWPWNRVAPGSDRWSR